MYESTDSSTGLLKVLDCQDDDFDHPIGPRSTVSLGCCPSKRLQNRQSRAKNIGKYTLVVGISALALCGLVDILWRSVEWTRMRLRETDPPCWCGKSDDEAIAMGCRYDHLAVDWLPPTCMDDELVDEFDHSGPDGLWPYFEEDPTLVPVPNQPHLRPSDEFIAINSTEIDAFARVGRGYWATTEWHINHCMFTWQKQFRAAYTGKSVEPWNNHEAHITHCREYILRVMRKKRPLDSIDTEVLGVNRHNRQVIPPLNSKELQWNRG